MINQQGDFIIVIISLVAGRADEEGKVFLKAVKKDLPG